MLLKFGPGQEKTERIEYEVRRPERIEILSAQQGDSSVTIKKKEENGEGTDLIVEKVDVRYSVVDAAGTKLQGEIREISAEAKDGRELTELAIFRNNYCVNKNTAIYFDEKAVGELMLEFRLFKNELTSPFHAVRVQTK